MKKIAIAPMLDWSDRHFRYFIRQITQETELYTEMIVADAILHGNLEKLLGHTSIERPLVVQLGGSDCVKLAQVCKICENYGFNTINLNVGCPSDRVKSGNFGACLMRDPSLVADCIKAMQDAVSIPISVKHRIGLGYENDFSFVNNFVDKVAETGCMDFIVHARNAILNGLSPKKNREIPLLRYDFVYQLKKERPELNFMINGGIKTVDEINNHLMHTDGVMLGREAYHNPFLLANFDNTFFNKNKINKSRKEIAQSMIEYLEQMQVCGVPLHHITRHMIGLYHGCNGAKIWRYKLTHDIIKSNDVKTYVDALQQMEE